MCIIPARGNSSLTKKNIMPLRGLPLIHYSISPAKLSKYIDDIYVSSEDEEIKSISNEMGAKIIDRPIDLSKDKVTTDEVMRHAVKFINCVDDIVVYMQPTDLFKNHEWIDECIEGLCSGDYTSSFVACSEHKNFWISSSTGLSRVRDKEDYSDRQVKIPIYREDTGLGSAMWASTIMDGKRVGDKPFVLTKDYYFFDIHSQLDFELAEAYLNYLRKQ